MTGFEKLENSLIDVIKEEQAKLGFKEEKIHLYYPLSSLNHFFLAQDSADEMAARLQNLPEELTSKLGECEGVLIKGTDSAFIFRSLEVSMCMRI